MLFVPFSKLRQLNWKIEVVPIEDVWTGHKNASGYRLTGLPSPINQSDPVTLQFLSGWAPQGGSNYINNVDNAVKDNHVDWGYSTNQVNGHGVPYSNSTYPSVGAALDHLLYVAPVVSSLTNTIGTVEIGSTVTSVTLNWSLNKTVTSQSLSQSIGTIDAALRTYTDTGSWTTDRSYTLTIGDGTNTATGSTSVLFRHRRYWGVSNKESLTDADILALSKEFSTSRAQTRSLTCTAQYIYFAWPSTFGAASQFTVNGLPNTAWILVGRAFVNASGYSSTFYIYRSENLLTNASPYTVVVS